MTYKKCFVPMLMLHDGCSSCNCYTPSKVHSHSFRPSFFADN